MNLEDYNYYGNSRVKEAHRKQPYRVMSTGNRTCEIQLSDAVIECLVDDGVLSDGHDGVFEIPVEWEVCDTCRGSGKVVNPNIDAGGLTREDFDEDPDFREEYFSGAYDVQCPECNGRNVTPAVRLPKEVHDAVNEWVRAEDEYLSERMNELRMGY